MLVHLSLTTLFLCLLALPCSARTEQAKGSSNSYDFTKVYDIVPRQVVDVPSTGVSSWFKKADAVISTGTPISPSNASPDGTSNAVTGGAPTHVSTFPPSAASSLSSSTNAQSVPSILSSNSTTTASAYHSAQLQQHLISMLPSAAMLSSSDDTFSSWASDTGNLVLGMVSGVTGTHPASPS